MFPSPNRHKESEGSESKVQPTKAASIQPMDTSNTCQAPKPAGNTPTGIQRYFNIINAEKRRRSPVSPKPSTSAKIPKTQPEASNNRYALLNVESDTNNYEPKHKPPPIYLREQSSKQLIKGINNLIGNEKYYIVDLKKGEIKETKIQAASEVAFSQLINWLNINAKNYYTYQMKSAKGLRVILKGIDHTVDPDEIKADIEEKGFRIKSVNNIRNKLKQPPPMFRVEFKPDHVKLPKGKTHPIYEVRYVVHRKITVDEPHKRTTPIQCQNCQEFGHTRTYCRLTSVCVACGECHPVRDCNKNKNDPYVKKCSNCNGQHTANYRGCPVYLTINRNKAYPANNNLPKPQFQSTTTHKLTPEHPVLPTQQAGTTSQNT